MFGLLKFWRSTVGKKVVMAVTGIIGILFVLGHMTGNLLMFKGQGAMHEYALLLRTSMPLLWAIRAVLLLAVAGAAGVLEWHRPPWGRVVIGALGVVGAIVALTRSDAGMLSPVPSIVAAGAARPTPEDLRG